MSAKRTKLGPGRYQVGSITVQHVPGKTARETGHTRTVSTWKDEATGKMLGYTLDDVAEVAAAREESKKRGIPPVEQSPVEAPSLSAVVEWIPVALVVDEEFTFLVCNKEWDQTVDVGFMCGGKWLHEDGTLWTPQPTHFAEWPLAVGEVAA